MKRSGIKVAVFPMGSIIRFRKDGIKRSFGRLEYYNLIWALARNPSISEIWLLQVSDWEQLTDDEKIDFDPRKVIRNIYAEFKVDKPNSKKQESYADLWNKISHLKQPDFAIVFSTQGLTRISIPNIIPKVKNPEEKAKCLEMTIRYCSSQMYYLNNSEIPYFLVVNDGRFLYTNTHTKYLDMFNLPKEIMGFYKNDDYILHHYDKMPDDGGKMTTDVVKLSYSKMIWLNNISEKIIDPANIEKTEKFSIVAMQAAYGKDKHDPRYSILKEWFLDVDGNEDVSIYGKWGESYVKDYQHFKGLKPHTEIDEIFKKTRYTLLIPTEPLWVTTKICEMLKLGVVPFLHPSYDEKNLSFGEDSFFRVKNPEDLKKKISFLEKNPDKRIKLIQKAQEKYMEGVTNGTCVVDAINPYLQRANIDVELQHGFSDELIRKRKVKKLF